MAAKSTKRRARAAARSADGRDSPVVYIHGIGKQAPPAELKLEWDLALFGRDLGSRSRMAYWADLLHPASEPMPVPQMPMR